VKTKILTEKNLEEAARLLINGEIVAFPTETVYGLGAPLFQPKSIRKIFSEKGRPQDNPLIVHISTLADCEKIAEKLPPLFFQLAEAFFPGPLTLIVHKKARVPSIVSAGLKTIAIRMPNHFVAQNLISLVGEPLVAPSANLSGSPSSTSAEHVIDDFNGKIAAIIDAGPCLHGIESTVIDIVSFEKPTILRPGALSKDAIEEFLKVDLAIYKKGPRCSPGMKYRHYAPKIPVYLFSKKNLFETHLLSAKNPFVLSTKELSLSHSLLQSKTLYSDLRLADQKGYDEVIIFCEECTDIVLLNRLEKISHESDCH